MVMDWAYFARCIKEHFVPPRWRNPLIELASLYKIGTIDNYTKHFMAHVACAGLLNKQQQVNMYTAGLLEPLKIDVEF
ncbi:unnamed protein product [Miscanthus lutarioriparius]|uniref:Uncharacterized protein n=1 Tax=Miscanthus lutarioriparius TaxID=422564 RepID=A0A811SS03_9POAL|nr:unnamed protein product [Miscanthus lutarioriparius]